MTCWSRPRTRRGCHRHFMARSRRGKAKVIDRTEEMGTWRSADLDVIGLEVEVVGPRETD